MPSYKEASRRTTALEAVQDSDLTGKTSLVTGGISGIGVETVKALAAAGSRVVLTSRSEEAGIKVAEQLMSEGVKGQIRVMQLDLADLASIKKFVKTYIAEEHGPDLLMLNAGIMACPQSSTKDGFEMQIGTNHFGHFALTKDLLPSMKALGRPARIVVVSSALHKDGAINLQDLHYRHRKYDPWGSYGIINTSLSRHFLGTGHFAAIKKKAFGILGSPWLKTVPQGAATSITAAVSPDLESHSGAYLQDSKIGKPAPAAEDTDMAAELWKETERQLAEAERKLV